jgi:hypothetical protein
MADTRRHARGTFAAAKAARTTAIALARDAGATITRRPAYRGSGRTVPDVEPLAGMLAARDLERAARDTALSYIRQARAAGHTWHQVGTALHLAPDGDPQQIGDTTAEAAYTYAAGSPHGAAALRYGRSFTWTCHACDQNISDRGLCHGPADDEHGHASNCPRLDASMAA